MPHARGAKAMSRTLCLLLSAIVAPLAAINAAFGQDGFLLQKRLLAEAPAAWERYRKFHLALEGTSSTENRRTAPQDERSEWKNRFQSKAWRDWRIEEFEMQQSEFAAGGKLLTRYTGTVYGKNSRYSFELTRKGPNDPWVIAKISDLRNGGSDEHEETAGKSCSGLFLEHADTDLPDLFKSSAFQVVHVSEEALDGKSLVAVTFTYAPPLNGSLRGGKILLDPGHDWVVRKGEIDLQGDKGDKYKKSFELDYQESPSSDPIVTAVRVWLTGTDEKGKEVKWEQQSSMDLYTAKYHPETDFSLGVYGLPEPFGMESPRPRWYLWGAGLGLICLFAGVWLRHRLQRAA